MKVWLKQNWLLILIILLGLSLRLYHLGHASLWNDEATTIFGSQEKIIDIIKYFWTSDWNPPLFWILMHFWINFFGISEIATRSLALVFGMGTIFVTYALAQSFFNKKVALLSAFLMSISVFAIAYSQEARMYSLLMFLSLFSMYFFHLLLTKRKKKFFYVYLLFSLFIVLTHTLGILLILAQTAYLLLRHKKNVFFLKILASHILFFLLAVLWILFLSKHAANTDIWPHNSLMWDLIYLIKNIIGSRPLLLIFSLIFIYLTYLFVFKKIPAKDRDKVLLLYLWLFIGVVPQIFFAAISQYLDQPFYLITRYLSATFPALIILVAVGISKIENKYFFSSVAAALIVFGMANVMIFFKTPNKVQWKESAAYVDSVSPDLDVVIFTYANDIAIFDYYSHVDIEKQFLLKDTMVPQKTDFEKLDLAGRNKVAIVSPLVRDIDFELLFKSNLSDYSLQEIKEFYAIDVYRFERN